MAHIMPSNVPELRLAGAAEAELVTLERLGRELPAAYTVIHGLDIARLSRTRQAFGEIDFVIVNQSGDVLLIEQKNGALAESDNDVVIHYANQDAPKSVIGQMYRSRRIFFGALEQANLPRVQVSSLLYCPDHRLESVKAAGLSVDAVVDAAADDQLAERIQALLPEGIDRNGVAGAMREFLSQTLSLAPDMGRTAAQHQAVYHRLASALQEIPWALEFTPWRLRIQAAAGAGKSLVAVEAYERALAKGERPLLVCFNRPLADTLQARLNDTEHVNTFHGHCDHWLRTYGRPDHFAPIEGDGHIAWDALVEQMAEVADQAGPYDLLIVDEGQDFRGEWFEVLRLAMADDFRCLWLEDVDQSLQGNEPVTLDGFVRFISQDNFRTPQRIARFIDRLLDKNVTWRNALPGYTPRINLYADRDAQRRLLDERIDALSRQGFRPEQIAIISLRGREGAIFSDQTSAGGERLRRYTGEIDDERRPVYTEGALHAETIYRFKGQQAPAIIVTDVVLSGDADKAAREEALLWCALTRATVTCELLVHEDCGWRKALRRAAS